MPLEFSESKKRALCLRGVTLYGAKSRSQSLCENGVVNPWVRKSSYIMMILIGTRTVGESIQTAIEEDLVNCPIYDYLNSKKKDVA